MRRLTAILAACAAVALPAGTAEQWEFVLGGELLGSEAIQPTTAGFTGLGSFTYQGAKIDAAYEIGLDEVGAPASYALTLTVPGAKITVASSASGGSISLTVSQNGVVAGTRAFAVSPSLVILDNNTFGQYRQLSRLLSPQGPARLNLQILVPQVLRSFDLEARLQPGTWRWASGGRSGSAVQWELSSPAPLLYRVWQDIAGGGILQVELPQARTVVRLAGASLAPDAGAAAAKPAYLSAGVEERVLAIRSGGLELGATMAYPKGATGRLPAVLLIGGSGPTDRDGAVGACRPYRDIAFGLAAKGFAVLRWDKRTFAYRGNLAAIDPERMGLREEYLDDAVAAFRQLAGDPRVDPDRISLAGHSLGAWVLPLVMQALGTDAARVRHLVFLAPVGRDMGATLLRQLRFRLSLNPGGSSLESIIADAERAFGSYRSTGRMPGPLLGGTASYWEDVLRADPIAAAGSLSTDMLLLRGAKDFQADASDLADWQRALAGRPNASCQTLDGLNHLLVEVPQGDSTGVEYFREGYVAPRLIDLVAARLSR